MTPLAPALEAFFTDRLLRQQRVSPNTIASYRDTFRLLLGFVHQTTRTPPARLELAQLDAPTRSKGSRLLARRQVIGDPTSDGSRSAPTSHLRSEIRSISRRSSSSAGCRHQALGTRGQSFSPRDVILGSSAGNVIDASLPGSFCLRLAVAGERRQRGATMRSRSEAILRWVW